jgi:hypothetical protein
MPKKRPIDDHLEAKVSWVREMWLVRARRGDQEIFNRSYKNKEEA